MSAVLVLALLLAVSLPFVESGAPACILISTAKIPGGVSFAAQASCDVCENANNHIAVCHRASMQHTNFVLLCVANEADALCHVANHGDGAPNNTIGNVTCDCDCNCTVAPVPSPIPVPVPALPSPVQAPTPTGKNGAPSPAVVPTPTENGAPSPISKVSPSLAPTLIPVVTPSPTNGSISPSVSIPTPVSPPSPGCPPAVPCSCPEEQVACTSPVCDAQCPNGGLCDAATGACVCEPCDDCEVEDCKVGICHFPIGNPENIQHVNISCSSLVMHLAHGDVFPDTAVDGVFYDDNCTATPVVCINTTTPPALCDCNDTSLETCTPLDCDLLCPSGGTCNNETHACECDPCVPVDECNVTVCHPSPVAPNQATLEVLPCDLVPEHLANGDFLPNSTVNGTFYNFACEAVPCLVLICHRDMNNPLAAELTLISCETLPLHLGHGDALPNTVLPGGLFFDANCRISIIPCDPNGDPNPTCDCLPGDPTCTFINCVEQCPNGGTCNPITHACMCDPCPGPDECFVRLCVPAEFMEDPYLSVQVSCDQVPEAIEGGSVLPNTTIGELFVDEQCNAHSIVCSNGTTSVCGNTIVEAGEECDSSLHCTEDCRLLRPESYCEFLSCTGAPAESEPDIITWFLEHCTCVPPPLPGNCSDSSEFIDEILCPTANANTDAGWAVLFLLFAVIAGLVLIIVGALAR